jgi:hypothetical protein
MKTTAYFILIGGIIASLYDVWAIIHGYSISRVMTNLFTTYPVVTFTIGFICGHWIGSIDYTKK